ncbi:MAG TPA: hypothetical protein VFH29_07105, partial [Anaerolineales bacterium]|nr:hypothetical protein [Anaerolineales bacterium]
LLSETGLPGLILFASFLFIVLAQALGAQQQALPGLRYVGIAALCTWIAMGLFNLTQDSFASPNIWLNLGILSGIVEGSVKSGIWAIRGDSPAMGTVRAHTDVLGASR